MKNTTVSLLAGAVLAIVLLTACEPVRCYRRLRVAPYVGATTPKPYGTVLVFQSEDELKRPYNIVGLMSCEGMAGEEADIVRAMLYRAADLGADAILLGGPKTPVEKIGGAGINVRVGWAAMIGNGNNRAYRAHAIRFKD